jgi:TPR repeat protein
MTMKTPEKLMRPAARLLVVLSSLLLTGCGAVAVETATIGWDKTQVWSNIDAARAGDPEAQYAVGEALCCSGDTATGTFYSTEDAMKWLCAAAAQGNTDAMVKLGQIFEGDQVDGLRLMRRAMNAVTDTPQNVAAAYYWYAAAGNAGVTESAGTADELFREMSVLDKETATWYLSRTEPPCCWADLQASGE